MKYDRITAVLVNAVKEQQDQIKQQQIQIETLKVLVVDGRHICGTSAGIGDVAIRGKVEFLSRPALDLALGVEVRLARSGRTFTANRATPLLDQLERAGEQPPYGCRIGICHTCQCTKRSGTVQNTITGAISSEPNEKIQLCISVPRSNVELEEEPS